MELFIYNVFLLLFKLLTRIAALFNTKADKWVRGRKNMWKRLEKEVSSQVTATGKTAWVHCASLGEFEQGRPIIEKLKSQFPQTKIILTFFSPSGYEVRKDYKGADWVFYLPMDGPQNAKRFFEIVRPSLVIFVKYEFWYYYLKQAKENNIPLLLVSAIFREQSVFFKWYGGLQRKMLGFFDHLFVQDTSSAMLLQGIGFSGNTSVSGDTRFDRVIEIAERFSPLPSIEAFIGPARTIIAGSTWPPDEEVLQKTLEQVSDPTLKLIIAPHEINESHILQVRKLFPGSVLFSEHSALYSQGLKTAGTERVLIIDNIGMLSKLYKYATFTYIGGGFGKGIHNTLEAAVYGKPVIFGPAYHKFREAIELIKTGGAFSISNAADNISIVEKLVQDTAALAKSSESSKHYVYNNRGATDAIMGFIQEKRLLTS